MIPCGDKAEVGGWGGRARWVCPPEKTLDVRMRRWGGSKNKLRNNKQRSLGFGVVTIRGWNISTS